MVYCIHLSFPEYTALLLQHLLQRRTRSASPFPDDILQIREIDGALTVEEQMEEFVFLGMRKIEGISIKKFQETFGKSLEECYGNGIENMKSKNLVEVADGMLRLTAKGIDLSNYVFAEILYE